LQVAGRRQQIVVLEFLRLRLKEMAGVKRESPLPDTLRRRQRVLTDECDAR
jgi:hypothetical protein